MKPKVTLQGVVVISPGDGGLMLMFPDGDVVWAKTPLAAQRKANAWLRRNADADSINVGNIEWRCGARPPV